MIPSNEPLNNETLVEQDTTTTTTTSTNCNDNDDLSSGMITEMPSPSPLQNQSMMMMMKDVELVVVSPRTMMHDEKSGKYGSKLMKDGTTTKTSPAATTSSSETEATCRITFPSPSLSSTTMKDQQHQLPQSPLSAPSAATAATSSNHMDDALAASSSPGGNETEEGKGREEANIDHVVVDDAVATANKRKDTMRANNRKTFVGVNSYHDDQDPQQIQQQRRRRRFQQEEKQHQQRNRSSSVFASLTKRTATSSNGNTVVASLPQQQQARKNPYRQTSSSSFRLSKHSRRRRRRQYPSAPSSVSQSKKTKICNMEQTVFFRSRKIRYVVLSTLFLLSLGAAIGVYFYIWIDEKYEFRTNFDIVSNEIVTNFELSVERKLNAINTISTSITSYAITSNQSFPFITIPDYAVRGSNVRILADALVIHWLPLVSNDNHHLWEQYALQNRYHINDSYQQDQMLRHQQDVDFELVKDTDEDDEKEEKDEEKPQSSPAGAEEGGSPDPYTLTDGTGYHTKIWDFGTHVPKENGTGPYLPFWQTTPINGLLQRNLNFDFGSTPVLQGVLPVVLQDKRAVLNSVVTPIPGGRANLNANLVLGQYRHDIEQYKEDPLTFMSYPVFTSFETPASGKREVGGILATLIYWRLYFTNILNDNVGSIICVITNRPFNQTFAYKIDGKDATYLGLGDPHDPKYDSMAVTENVNSYVRSKSGPETRSYTTVPLHETYGQYIISIYPTSDFENDYITDNPIIYALIVGGVFLVTSTVFAYMLSRALTRDAQVETERNMTAYFAHELRNPLGAIDSALQSLPADDDVLSESTKELINGMQICTSFMSNLMNNLLDARQLQEGKMVLHPHPASLHEILTDVRAMLEPSVRPGVEFRTEFHTNRIDPQTNRVENYDYVYCDVHRFRQVMANVVTNAIKYTLEGSITLSIGWDDCITSHSSDFSGAQEGSTDATKGDAADSHSDDCTTGNFCSNIGESHLVRFICEDTGPGIPKSQQEQLFQRFVQRGGAPGSGLGLAIAKLIVDQMGGTIWFESDPTVKPGTKCIVQVPMEVCCDQPNDIDIATSITSKPSQSALPQKASSNRGVSSMLDIPNDSKRKMPSGAASPPDSSATASSCIRTINDPRHHGQNGNQLRTPIVEEMSFLIVDDIKMNRLMLKRRLQKAIALNCTVYEAASGEEALELLAGDRDCHGDSSGRSCSAAKDETTGRLAVTVADDVEQQLQPQECPPRRFDVIIVDQYMEESGGVMLGTDTVFAMRRMKVDSLIIGCSGNDMNDEFLEAGADIFWGKPLPSNPEIICQLRRGLFEPDA